MITRRKLFGFGGMTGLTAIAPIETNRLFDPGRRITHLPGGGTLIEDQTFTTGIMFQNVDAVEMKNCCITINDLEATCICYNDVKEPQDG